MIRSKSSCNSYKHTIFGEMMQLVSCACVFFWGVFLLRFIGFDLLLDVRHELVLSRLLLLLLHGLSTVAWFGSWIVYHGLLGALLHGLWCVAWCASWIVICCLTYVMDCVSWFLGCRVVAWVMICCLVYVMDCASWFLAVLLHGLRLN